MIQIKVGSFCQLLCDCENERDNSDMELFIMQVKMEKASMHQLQEDKKA